MSSAKYTHAVIHETGNELAFSLSHAQALLLEGLSIGWESPVIVAFGNAYTEEESRELLKRIGI